MAPPKKDASEPTPPSLFHSFAPLLEAAADGIHILTPPGNPHLRQPRLLRDAGVCSGGDPRKPRLGLGCPIDLLGACR